MGGDIGVEYAANCEECQAWRGGDGCPADPLEGKRSAQASVMEAEGRDATGGSMRSTTARPGIAEDARMPSMLMHKDS